MRADPLELAVELVGSMSLLFSTLIIAVFVVHKLRKQPREAFYHVQNTNVMLGWAFLTCAMFAAVFVESWWERYLVHGAF